MNEKQIDELSTLLKFSGASQSQHKQDLFVLSELGFKRDGYFVEFGATNGKDISNTWLLENNFGWTGIVAEPGKNWQESLKQNRKCHVDTRCVWSETGKTLTFNQTQNPDLSCINDFSNSDMWGAQRAYGTRYDVETISLMDLLKEYDAPKEIDYLSIDTEGSEFEILSNFDFNEYKIKVITCEHNHTPMRTYIQQLLAVYGYVCKYPNLSDVDDWFVLE
jgi:FkbM family methyltransferase